MITICQQALNDCDGSTSSTSSSSSSSASISFQFQKAIYDDPREYGSFHLGTATSTGHNGRSSSPNAVSSSSCIISDHRHHRKSNNSTPSKPFSTSSLNDNRISSSHMGGASKTKRGANEGVLKRDNGVISSGISSATMMNDDDVANPEDQIIMTANETISPTAAQKMMNDEQYYYEQEQENETWFILPESSVIRAAFHEPPPLYPNDIHRAKLEQSPFSVNAIDGSVGDSVVVEATSSASTSALASLIERCTEEGSPRLRMCQQRKQHNVVESTTTGGDDERLASKENDFSSSDDDLSSIVDRLSDFKSFRISLSPVF